MAANFKYTDLIKNKTIAYKLISFNGLDIEKELVSSKKFRVAQSFWDANVK